MKTNFFACSLVFYVYYTAKGFPTILGIPSGLVISIARERQFDFLVEEMIKLNLQSIYKFLGFSGFRNFQDFKWNALESEKKCFSRTMAWKKLHRNLSPPPSPSLPPSPKLNGQLQTRKSKGLVTLYNFLSNLSCNYFVARSVARSRTQLYFSQRIAATGNTIAQCITPPATCLAILRQF